MISDGKIVDPSAKMPVQIRPATEEDVPFIFNAWLKSYRKSFFAQPINNTIYFAEHHKVLEHLAKTSTVVVACDPKEPSQLFGFGAGTSKDGITIIHYIYIKHTYRQLGIGKLIAKSLGHEDGKPTCYTHQTSSASKLAEKHNLLYHPYLAFPLYDGTEAGGRLAQAPSDNESAE